MEKNLVEALVLFDLTEYEARTYLAMLECGRSSAILLASSSGVPRTRIYEVIGSLCEKGFATIVSSSPRLASPVPPSQALGGCMARKVSRMQEALRLVEEKARAPHRKEKKATRVILSGRKSIIRTLAECADASREILIWGVPAWFFSELEFLGRLRGKRAEMIVSSFEDISSFVGEGFSVYSVKRIFFTGVFVFDRREAVAFPYVQSKGKLEGIWTSHRDSVDSFLSAYLDHKKFAERI